MKVEKLKDNFTPSNNSLVSVKHMGNITEIRSMVHEPKATIKKLDKRKLYYFKHSAKSKILKLEKKELTILKAFQEVYEI